MKAKDVEIKKSVQERYGQVAKAGGSCCGPSSCGCKETAADKKASRLIGYSAGELKSIPGEADLGLGCGNPTALAGLKKGEVVLDLGAGAGIDCFLAARKVGRSGRVIGVDMTPEMIDKARANARAAKYSNVEFRLGEIENLPAADASVDVVISNCVVNLSTDKPRVFREAFRVLKPGGRMMVSDLVLSRPLPRVIRDSVDAYASCIAGAMLKEDYLAAIRKGGFQNVEVTSEQAYPADLLLAGCRSSESVQEPERRGGKKPGYLSSVISLGVRTFKPGKKRVGT